MDIEINSIACDVSTSSWSRNKEATITSYDNAFLLVRISGIDSMSQEGRTIIFTYKKRIVAQISFIDERYATFVKEEIART